MADNEKENAPVTLETLHRDISVLTLGALTAAELAKNGVVSLYVGQNGQIELAAPGELGLDALPEEQAIQELLSQQVPEGEIEDYLKGRDARLQRSLERRQ